VRFGDRSDEELIRLAQAGWAPAFAVLVHRYAPVVRATRPRAEPAVPFLTHVFLQAMRELRSRDPRAPVAPWLLGIAGAGARSAKAPVPLSTEELDAIWTRLHGSWPNGHRHAPAVPWRRTAAIIGLAALAGLVPAVVLGADGTDADGELLELRAVPLPDERTATVAEDQDDDENPTSPSPRPPRSRRLHRPSPWSRHRARPRPPSPTPQPEPEDPGAGADDDPDGQAEDTTPDEEAEDDEDSGGLLDGVLGDEDEDDEDDEDDSDEGAVEQDPDEEAAAEDAASDEPEDS
jgi:hypothetical protein